MDAEQIRDHVLLKENVSEGFPFGESTLVFKVAGKVFLLIALDANPLRFNVKCNPDKAEELREEYPDIVLPGFHMNKKHWNTIIVAGMKNAFFKEMIDHSYELVAPKIKMKKK